MRNFNRVLSNSVHGFLGFILPAVAMFSCYPTIISKLGNDAFGVFALALSIPSLIRVVDLGFFAATVHFVARDLSKNNIVGVGHTCMASLMFYGGLGVVGGGVAWVISPWLSAILNVPSNLTMEAIKAFQYAALQIPAVLLTSCITSIFKGIEKFHLSMWVLTLQAVLSYGFVALGVYYFNFELGGALAVMALVNFFILLVAILIGVFVLSKMGVKWSIPTSFKVVYLRMFNFGYVMAINSVVAILVTQLPKFLISWAVGPAASGIYSLVFSVSSKIQAGVNASVEIIFPYSSGEKNQRKLKYVFTVVFVISVMIAFLAMLPLWLFSYEILDLWVGSEMAMDAFELLQLFAISAFFLSIVAAPYHLLNGLGLPWKNTWLIVFHLLCLVVFLGGLVFSNIYLLTAFGYAFIFANASLMIAYLVVIKKQLNIKFQYKEM